MRLPRRPWGGQLCQTFTGWSTANTVRHAKHTMEAAHHVAHTHRKKEGLTELEVPADLQDMEIPLKGMGNVIVFIGL